MELWWTLINYYEISAFLKEWLLTTELNCDEINWFFFFGAWCRVAVPMVAKSSHEISMFASSKGIHIGIAGGLHFEDQ